MDGVLFVIGSILFILFLVSSAWALLDLVRGGYRRYWPRISGLFHNPSRDRIEVFAYHEAGHILAARSFPIREARVTEHGGRVVVEWSFSPEHAARKLSERLKAAFRHELTGVSQWTSDKVKRLIDEVPEAGFLIDQLLGGAAGAALCLEMHASRWTLGFSPLQIESILGERSLTARSGAEEDIAKIMSLFDLSAAKEGTRVRHYIEQEVERRQKALEDLFRILYQEDLKRLAGELMRHGELSGPDVKRILDRRPWWRKLLS